MVTEYSVPWKFHDTVEVMLSSVVETSIVWMVRVNAIFTPPEDASVYFWGDALVR